MEFRRHSLRLALVLFSVLVGLDSPPPSMAQEVVAIRGGTVIDGTGRPPIPNATILVRGERIEAIGPGITPPAGAEVIDASGKYILPGLWDKHLHYKGWFPELMISNGVTSGWAQEGGAWIEAQREGVLKGKILGPRMFIRVRSVDFWGDPEEARRMTRQIIEEGADFVKIYTGTPPAIAKVVAEEAHRAGKIVEGHFGITARQAIEAGANGLTHSTGIELDMVPPEVLEKQLPTWRAIDTGRGRVIWPKVATWTESKTGGPNPDLTEYWLWIEDPRRLMLFGMMDQSMAKDLINLMVSKQIYIEGCLTYIFRHVHDRAQEYRMEDHLLLNDPNLHYIPGTLRENVLDYSLLDNVTPDELALMKKGYKNYQWFIKNFVDAGGKIIVGPDTTSLNHATMLPGVTTRRELQLLVDAGVSPMKAIQFATQVPAEMLGKGRDLGTLERGKYADLLVLNKNPLDDITAFKEIERVMQGGRWLPLGYHYYFSNPIPRPFEDEISFPGLQPPSQTPELITSIAPEVVVEESGALTLTVKGQNFLSSAVVQLDGQWLRTEVVSPTELRASVPAEFVTRVGTYAVRVVHRSPGWGETNTVYFIVKFR